MGTLPAFHRFPLFPHLSYTHSKACVYVCLCERHCSKTQPDPIHMWMKRFTAVPLCLQKEEEKELAEVCRRLMANMQEGNCTLSWQQHNGKIHFDCVEINGKGRAAPE